MIDFFCFGNMIFVRALLICFPSFFAQLILVKVCFTYFLVFAHLVFVKACLIYSSGFCSVGICKSVCIPAFGSLCSIAASILCFFSPLLINLSQKCSLCPFGRLLSRREVACSYVILISCDFYIMVRTVEMKNIWKFLNFSSSCITVVRLFLDRGPIYNWMCPSYVPT